MLADAMFPDEVIGEIERHILNCGPCMSGKPDAVHAKWFHGYVLKMLKAVITMEKRTGKVLRSDVRAGVYPSQTDGGES